ncbi:MAG TPA: SUMF1/EgtB/PvdO family nonheme iron enzyme [bacterium]|nr:SUMF1/EgtB/PvdO family nonheme iron enzyme [bacterium]
MTKYLFFLAALTLMIACTDGAKTQTDDTIDNDTAVDNDTVTDNIIDNDTAETDDTLTDNLLTDEPGDDSDTQPDELMTDTEQPDVDHGTGTPGEMVSVPAGEFQMGCNEAVDDICGGDEFPYHAVTLSAYQIGKYEVTVAEYRKCVESGACNNGGEHIHYSTKADEFSRCNFGAEGRDAHPMQCVTWYGAKAYCEWIGQRLPTEAEWEKAARGTDGRKYPWGNEPLVSCDHAVIDDGSGEGCGTLSTWPVGSKPNGVSPYGAHDMIGNVAEWVNDWYDGDYYATSPANDPAGPEISESRVSRGGAWFDYSGNLFGSNQRASYRDGCSPDGCFGGAAGDGFRCAQ